MKKKLMAVAVAGALAAPALAVAQTSTVQIYGRITYEYAIIDQGFQQHTTDYADSPGGSAIGFRGEEKLGGGLSAWFQCESTADVRAIDQTGFCTRNSAVGFKGGWGNVHFGRWDTPMKRALNVGTVGAEETGSLGMSFLPFGGSGGSDATTTGGGAQRQRWKRREAGLTYYESPRFNGFQVLGAFSTGNAAADVWPIDGAPGGTANAQPRVWSLAGTYQNGPWGVGLAYEQHNGFGPRPSAVELDDRAWGLSVAYTFGGNIKVGATYLDAEFENGAATSLDRQTWTIGVDWRIQGPHSIQAQYAYAGDCEGFGPSIGGNGGCTADLGLGGTGGDAISLAYSYAFSKRTRIKFAYVRVDNDSNTSSFALGTASAPARNGENQSAYGFHIQHNF